MPVSVADMSQPQRLCHEEGIATSGPEVLAKSILVVEQVTLAHLSAVVTLGSGFRLAYDPSYYVTKIGVREPNAATTLPSHEKCSAALYPIY